MKSRQVCWILGLTLLPIVFLLSTHDETMTKGQTAISTLFITITSAKPDTNYQIILKGDSVKDQISITPDSETTNLNYSPPSGVIINPNDQACIGNKCVSIPQPDSFGTSSVNLVP